MTDFVFTPATKAQAKARIALAGPSGSGKTYTALLTAFTLGSAVGVIDTERGSASKYVGLNGWAFETLPMHYYDPRDLVRALAAASKFDVVIVDSLSHFWMGSGGMLEQVDAAAKRSFGGNNFGGWKEAAPMERAMIDALLSFPGHVIVTMRTKTEWVVDVNERGKSAPRRVGTKPVQRDGIEYEADIVGEMDLENTMVITKSRCAELAGAVIRRPDEEFGRAVLAWLDDGVKLPAVEDYMDQAMAPDATYEGLRALHAEVSRRNLLGAPMLDDAGEPTTLGDLIVAKGRAAQQRERETAGATA